MTDTFIISIEEKFILAVCSGHRKGIWNENECFYSFLWQGQVTRSQNKFVTRL